jgi:predicted hydrocarbon binding protein
MITAIEAADQAQEIRDKLRVDLVKTVTRFAKKHDEGEDVDGVAFQLGVEWAAMMLAAMSAILAGESKAHFVEFAEVVFRELEEEKHPRH